MNLLEGATNSLSILKDPFHHQNIEAVMLRMWRWRDGTFRFYATVEFQNGNTKGEQKIEADNFSDLIKKTEAFIKTLESNTGK